MIQERFFEALFFVLGFHEFVYLRLERIGSDYCVCSMQSGVSTNRAAWLGSSDETWPMDNSEWVW